MRASSVSLFGISQSSVRAVDSSGDLHVYHGVRGTQLLEMGKRKREILLLPAIFFRGTGRQVRPLDLLLQASPANDMLFKAMSGHSAVPVGVGHEILEGRTPDMDLEVSDGRNVDTLPERRYVFVIGRRRGFEYE